MASAENKITLPQENAEENREAILENTGETAVPKGSKTSDYYRVKKIPARFDNPECFHGYEKKSQNPFYRTTNSSYGGQAPTVHTMPTAFHARTQKFSGHLGLCGMYRNKSLNTAMDQSKV